MIVILGRVDDSSTAMVAEWLYKYGAEYIIFNTDDTDSILLQEYNPNKKKFIIKKGEDVVNLYETTAVWNRRHGFSPRNITNQYLSEKSSFFFEKESNYHYKHAVKESEQLWDFIHYFIEKNAEVVIGSYFFNDVNKLIILDKANELGIKTPKTFIVSTKNDLLDIKNESIGIITKACSQGVYVPYLHTKYQYYNYVNELSNDFINELPESFFPSLIQEKEQKKIELRIFYFYGECYSMAIFSQDTDMSKTDFRQNMDWISPLVNVPYKLPLEVEEQIRCLMDSIFLNTGSLDFIVNSKDEYIFLEVNPCGQFQMTSQPCNYYLEKKIALKLLEKDE